MDSNSKREHRANEWIPIQEEKRKHGGQEWIQIQEILHRRMCFFDSPAPTVEFTFEKLLQLNLN